MSEILEQSALERWKQRPIDFITEVLRRPKDAKPFALFDAQKQWFSYCWQLRHDGTLLYPEQTLSWIKKTGKTTTAAMELLTTTLVFGGTNAQAFCVASDLQQATERVFADIKQIIEASPLLKREAVIQQHTITFPSTGAVIQAIGADSSGAAGARPTFISVDEAHTITTERARRLFDEMIPITSGDQKISVRLITSHAGYSGESTLLEEIYARGMALPEIENGLRAGSGCLFTWSHECLAPWQTEAWLHDQRQRTRPLQFRRQFENEFVTSETNFTTGEQWDECVTLSGPPPSNPMMPVYIGVDASVKRDSTAICVVNGEKDSGVRVNAHKIFIPTTSNPIDFEVVERVLLDLKKKWPLATFIFDPTQMAFMMQRFNSLAGSKVEEFVQNPKNLSAMTQNLSDLIRYRKLAVYPDRHLRHAATTAVVVEKSDGPRFVKTRKDHNDVIIALAMAALVCVQRFTSKPTYRLDVFDENFRDEDLPPLPLEPEYKPQTPDSHWHENARKAPRMNDADANLKSLYQNIDSALQWGGPQLTTVPWWRR
jgi:phage terminase large subunit-like protein